MTHPTNTRCGARMCGACYPRANLRPLPRWQLIAGLLSALVLVLMLAWQPVPAPIMEDDPRWDCRTMGNLTCGPGAPHPAGYYGD